MLDKFNSFIRKNENKSEPEKLDSKYLIQFVDDIINSLGDINGVDNIIKLKNFTVSGEESPDSSDKFVIRYLLHLNNVDMKELNLEIENCKSHLDSENLILDVGDPRPISDLKEAILIQVYTSKYRRSKKVK